MFECQLHINEILLTQVMKSVEGTTSGPGRRAAESAYNLIPSIGKPTESALFGQDQIATLEIPVTRKARLAIRTKLTWYSEQREERTSEGNSII